MTAPAAAPAVLAARIALACPLSAWTGRPGACRWCDADLPARRTAYCSSACHRAFEAQHVWRKARAAARRRAKYLCSQPGCQAPRRAIEINHIDPRNGGGYGPGCHHHGTNLESLCRPHHQAETNRQRAGRRAAAAGGPA